jgi:hypothetical protein
VTKNKTANLQTRARVFELLVEKEKRLGRRIKPSEIVAATGISHSTVTSFIKGKPIRFDAVVIDALMGYFEITSYDLFFEKKVIDDGTESK